MKAAERIRLSIEESIRDGSLLPGDAVDEQQLMQTYEVSRTPVREALLQLQAQGLLNSLPRGGWWPRWTRSCWRCGNCWPSWRASARGWPANA